MLKDSNLYLTSQAKLVTFVTFKCQIFKHFPNYSKPRVFRCFDRTVYNQMFFSNICKSLPRPPKETAWGKAQGSIVGSIWTGTIVPAGYD